MSWKACSAMSSLTLKYPPVREGERFTQNGSEEAESNDLRYVSH
jgi:hypothetical protein